MPPTWLLVLALGVALATALGFAIRVHADLAFNLSSRPAFRLSFFFRIFHWEKPWFRVGDGDGDYRPGDGEAEGNSGPMTAKRTETEARDYPESPRQGGFIRLPSWRILRTWRAGIRSRSQRALFRLATEPRFWLGLLRLGGKMPRIFWQSLHIQVSELRLSLANPASLGQWLGLSHALSSALGQPLPLGCDFIQRAPALRGQLRARMNVWDAVGLGLRLLLSLPWFLAFLALGKGLFSRGFSGWRGSVFRLVLKGVRRGIRRGPPASR